MSLPRVSQFGAPAALIATLLTAFPGNADATRFEVVYGPELHAGPISTRVYVMLGPAKPALGSTRSEPRFGPNWFRPQPFFAVEVKDLKPGEVVLIDENAAGYPGPLSALEPGEYQAQAVIRLNPDTHRLGDGEGNAYGPMVTFTFGPNADHEQTIKLPVDKIVPPKKFNENDRIKLVEIDSPMLSAFHHRPIKHRAAVILPEGDPKEKRGILYIIPGFGGDHFMAERIVKESRKMGFGKDLIRVVLNPDCGTGHHAFADSAFNGPRGKALIEELIPHIEKIFPAIAEPRARLLNGHSSGGWSSLWLQVTYPEFFGGVWSTSPDPVDFRDFQKIDLYAKDANMFRDPKGERRPIARMGTRAVLFYDNFSKMEDVIGDGGQLHSFEAVFSPLGSDGRPAELWDRKTGAVNPEVAKAWRAYDINQNIVQRCRSAPISLRGKIRVVTGELDTFYLEGAVALLKGTLQGLVPDAIVEIVHGRDHGTVIDAKLSERFDKAMNAAVGIKAK